MDYTPIENPATTTIGQQLAAQLLTAQETLAPIYDAAEGVKADMIGRGWSPQNAEAAALAWLQAVLASFR